MAFTDNYSLETFDYGTTGWNGAYSSNFEKLDDLLYDISTTASGSEGDLETHKSADDHTIYPKVDGSRGFTATVSGVDPVDSDDLATKNYVDTEVTTVTASGISGWADDGTNFRLTFTNGIITAVGTTVSGGYSQS